MQIGQTEPAGDTRRCTMVHREVKFVQNTRHFIAEIRQMTNFHLSFRFALTLQLSLKGFVKHFFCLVWCAHFATPPLISAKS